MKKLIALTLSVTMILSLSACGKKEQIPSNNASNNSDNTGKTIALTLATAALKALRSRSVALL